MKFVWTLDRLSLYYKALKLTNTKLIYKPNMPMLKT